MKGWTQIHLRNWDIVSLEFVVLECKNQEFITDAHGIPATTQERDRERERERERERQKERERENKKKNLKRNRLSNLQDRKCDLLRSEKPDQRTLTSPAIK